MGLLLLYIGPSSGVLDCRRASIPIIPERCTREKANGSLGAHSEYRQAFSYSKYVNAANRSGSNQLRSASLTPIDAKDP
jgi:hypothetical protein